MIFASVHSSYRKSSIGCSRPFGMTVLNGWSTSAGRLGKNGNGAARSENVVLSPYLRKSLDVVKTWMLERYSIEICGQW